MGVMSIAILLNDHAWMRSYIAFTYLSCFEILLFQANMRRSCFTHDSILTQLQRVFGEKSSDKSPNCNDCDLIIAYAIVAFPYKDPAASHIKTSAL